MENYVQVGKLKKTFGSNGDISYRLFSEIELTLKVNDPIFLLIEGIYVPFFLTKFSLDKKSVLHFEDIDSLQDAELLAGNAIYLDSKDLKFSSNPSEQLEFSFLKGFSIIDQHSNHIGIINDIISYPMQEMAVIEKNVLLPLNESLIIDVRLEEQEVMYELIDGLVD